VCDDLVVATSDRASIERPRLSQAYEPVMPVIVMLAIMWAAEIVDVPLGGRLDRFGIRPRRIDGLDGVVLSPFLHDGLGHLIANTLPFVILGAAIAFGNTKRFLQVTLIVAVVAGLGTWLTGPDNTIHIGASGLVFGYVTYLVSRGIFARKLSYILGGILVVMFYGGVLWGLLPRPGVSWQGHLFGAIGGIAAAALIHGEHPTQSAA
jgi:membrane associated rhomboid family serine protease